MKLGSDSKIEKILIIRFSSLGDVILTTALLPNLKAAWPNAEITFLTKKVFSPLLETNPHLDRIRLYDPSAQAFADLTRELRAEKYDLVLDLHGNLRSWWIRFMLGSPYSFTVDKVWFTRQILVWFKKSLPALKISVRERILKLLSELGVKTVSIETQLFPQNAEGVLKIFSIDPNLKIIGLAPGAKHPTKRWTIDGFAESANRIGAIKGTHIVLLGDKSDKDVIDAVSKKIFVPTTNLAGWTNLTELISVVSKLTMLISNDSGLMHMAEALNIPVVAIFGPTVRSLGFAPYRKTSRVVEASGLPCRPCTLHGDLKCPLVHHKCMTDIDENAVLMAASMLLEKTNLPIASVSEGGI